jgi:hypothetical protein
MMPGQACLMNADMSPDLRTPRPRAGHSQSVSLTLSTGKRYAFRYYRDGRWFNDDQADGYEPNEYGQKNCILDLTTI